MKLYSTFNKLPLIALLSLGLACSPLVASADDGDRGRHGHYQQDRGKSHHRSDHRRDYRDYGHRHNHGYRNSYRKDYKHGYKKIGRRHDRQHGHHGHYVDVHRRDWHGHHNDRAHFMLGLYSDDLDVIIRD